MGAKLVVKFRIVKTTYYENKIFTREDFYKFEKMLGFAHPMFWGVVDQINLSTTNRTFRIFSHFDYLPVLKNEVGSGEDASAASLLTTCFCKYFTKSTFYFFNIPEILDDRTVLTFSQIFFFFFCIAFHGMSKRPNPQNGQVYLSILYPV